MAPQVGLEPTTLRLTAGCSAIELLRSGSTLACVLELSKKSYQRLQLIGNSRVGMVPNDQYAVASWHPLTADSLPRGDKIILWNRGPQDHRGSSRLPRERVPSDQCSAN